MKIDQESNGFKELQRIATCVVQAVEGIGKVLIPIATSIQKKLNEIDPEKLQVFLENLERFQRNEPYLNKLIADLKMNTNLVHANESLFLAHFMQLIYENEEDPQSIDILDIVNTEYFNNEFFSQFENIEMGENFRNRKNVLKEAFELYKLGFYAGSLCILYGQLEGVLTDYLLYKKALTKKNKAYKYIGETIPDTRICNGKGITGIFDKIKIAKSINKSFETLDAYKIDDNYQINSDRNDILHGNSLDRFTKERCFIVILWLASIFNFFEVESTGTVISKR